MFTNRAAHFSRAVVDADSPPRIDNRTVSAPPAVTGSGHASDPIEALASSAVVALRDLHSSIALKLCQAHATHAEATQARLCAMDSTDLDFRMAWLVHEARVNLAKAVSILKLQGGGRLTHGMQPERLIRDVRTLQQALVAADQQASRLQFVLDRVATNAPTEKPAARTL